MLPRQAMTKRDWLDAVSLQNINQSATWTDLVHHDHLWCRTDVLKAHWDVLAAIDFTTAEIWNRGGLVTHYLLFAMELVTCRVHFTGCTPNLNEAWMKQVARNLTGPVGFLLGKRYVLMDRDGKVCPAFREILKGEGVEPLLLPPRSPDLNAAEEQVRKEYADLEILYSVLTPLPKRCSHAHTLRQ